MEFLTTAGMAIAAATGVAYKVKGVRNDSRAALAKEAQKPQKPPGGWTRAQYYMHQGQEGHQNIMQNRKQLGQSGYHINPSNEAMGKTNEEMFEWYKERDLNRTSVYSYTFLPRAPQRQLWI